MVQRKPGQKPDLSGAVKQSHVLYFVREATARAEPPAFNLRMLVEEPIDAVGGRNLDQLPAIERLHSSEIVLVGVYADDGEPISEPTLPIKGKPIDAVGDLDAGSTDTDQ